MTILPIKQKNVAHPRSVKFSHTLALTTAPVCPVSGGAPAPEPAQTRRAGSPISTGDRTRRWGRAQSTEHRSNA